MRCLIYARVSLDPKGQGLSVAQQETECRAWADRQGWTITGVIAETGSASRYARSTRARTRWDEVTTAIATGDYDALLTWEASRATRDLTAYAALRDLCATHGVSWGYSGTLYNLTTRTDRFRTGLDALMAEDESARTSERVRRAVRDRATKGRPHGKLPYGYRREYDPATGALLRQVPDEEQAPIVQEIYDRLVAGDSLYALARDFTAREIQPPRPPLKPRPFEQTWLPITIRRIALSPTYNARRIHQGTDMGPADWPPLVTTETWEKTRAVLTDPGRKTRPGDTSAAHLLSGIATCGVCHTPVRKIKNRTTPSYSCMKTGCMAVSRSKDKTDAYVTTVMLQLLERHGARLTETPVDRPDVAAARANLKSLRDRLDGFIDAAAGGSVSSAALARIEATLGPQITAAERRLNSLLVPAVLEGVDLSDPESVWEAWDLPQKRRVVRELVDVEILPVLPGANFRVFDTSRIRVTPKWAGPGAPVGVVLG